MSRYAAGAVVPLAVVSLLAVGGSATAAATPAASKKFCSESQTLVKDLLHFGTLPKTTPAVSGALAKVDRELAQLTRDAPGAGDRKTITSMRAEFATLRKIVIADPDATRPADLAFIKGFSKTSARQGGVFGAEIKTACR